MVRGVNETSTSYERTTRRVWVSFWESPNKNPEVRNWREYHHPASKRSRHAIRHFQKIPIRIVIEAQKIGKCIWIINVHVYYTLSQIYIESVIVLLKNRHLSRLQPKKFVDLEPCWVRDERTNHDERMQMWEDLIRNKFHNFQATTNKPTIHVVYYYCRR
jgi:hypothetical protein